MGAARVSALRSGSSGNVYLLEDEQSRVVVDCGVNGKQFAAALAQAEVPEDEISQIQGIVVTHEHSDHVCGLGVVMRRYKLPVYMSEGTYKAVSKRLGRVDENLINIIKAGERFSLGNFEIAPFSVSHDAAEPLAYSFYHERAKVSICTDTGVVDESILQELQGSKIVFLEANYEPDLLEMGPYPYYLKERIRSERGHLSNQRSGEVCRALLESGTEYFTLSHLSQQNNFPKIAHLVAKEHISLDDAEEGRDYQLLVANRYQATEAVYL